MVIKSSKNFEKIFIFEDVTAVFLLRCQNSSRWEISLICHWNIDSWKQKMSVGYVMVPNIDQNIIWIQYKLHLVRAITNMGQYWWKSKNFMPENAWFQGYFTEVNFYTSLGNQLSYLQNDYFSKNLWWFHEPHNQVKCR